MPVYTIDVIGKCQYANVFYVIFYSMILLQTISLLVMCILNGELLVIMVSSVLLLFVGSLILFILITSCCTCSKFTKRINEVLFKENGQYDQASLKFTDNYNKLLALNCITLISYVVKYDVNFFDFLRVEIIVHCVLILIGFIFLSFDNKKEFMNFTIETEHAAILAVVRTMTSALKIYFMVKQLVNIYLLKIDPLIGGCLSLFATVFGLCLICDMIWTFIVAPKGRTTPYLFAFISNLAFLIFSGIVCGVLRDDPAKEMKKWLINLLFIMLVQGFEPFYFNIRPYHDLLILIITGNVSIADTFDSEDKGDKHAAEKNGEDANKKEEVIDSETKQTEQVKPAEEGGEGGEGEEKDGEKGEEKDGEKEEKKEEKVNSDDDSGSKYFY